MAEALVRNVATTPVDSSETTALSVVAGEVVVVVVDKELEGVEVWPLWQ
jgi:hypothetical protein